MRRKGGIILADKKIAPKIPVRGKRIDRLDIRISGSGGQGIISTGMILGKAVAVGDGKNVSQSQSYGPEARGGSTYADIIISDGEIYFPECNDLDLLVAFTGEAYEKFSKKTKESGLIIADESAVDVLSGNAATIKIPFIAMAREKFGTAMTANIICLGFLSSFGGIVSEKSLKETVAEEYQGSRHLDMNMKSLEDGISPGKKFQALTGVI